MIALYITLGVLLLLILVYLFLLYPGKARKGIFSDFEGKHIAHRGLFNNEDVPENSLLAFHRAMEAGLPIELDVQLTKDDRLVVFHDDNLERMCGIQKKVIDCTYEELCSYPLLGTDQYIPLFLEVLDYVAESVPLLIEVKAYGNHIEVTKSLKKHMKNYTGRYAVQSFHPEVVKWYKKNDPAIARGLLATVHKSKKGTLPLYRKLFVSTLLLSFRCRPDFISYNRKYADIILPFKIINRLYRTKCAGWTFKNKKQVKDGKNVFSAFIFDSFTP